MEGVGMNEDFWRGKRVLITGHTGFKGSWLALWLQKLGATVAGYALPPTAPNNLFELAAVGNQMESICADVLDRRRLDGLFAAFRPEIVFHLAAQPLVRKSYREPVETYMVNVMGTIHVLEAVRATESCRVVVNVTSDKCYENKEWVWGYREDEPMGGYDPYSSSKGCAELVTAAYRRSFFEAQREQRVALASARAGNVIGGGDFSEDRLIPDFMTAIANGKRLYIRNPEATRPWQHVLEPLSGYLLLAEKLWHEPARHTQGWNFGPAPDDIRPVRWIVERLRDLSSREVAWDIDTATKPHEARSLVLDSTKARTILGWQPRWTLDHALRLVVEWYESFDRGDSIREVVLQQITSYETELKDNVALPLVHTSAHLPSRSVSAS